MKLLYAKRFSKDVDGIQKEAKIKKDLVEVIENIREAGSLAELKGVRKITGYGKYYRIRLGDYRLGIKATKKS